MLISKISGLSGRRHAMTIDVTITQIREWEDGDKNIQDALPHLSADEREFLMTGITPKEWEDVFGDENV